MTLIYRKYHSLIVDVMGVNIMNAHGGGCNH